MAKGDHSRSQNRIDEQMRQSQGYLTGVQQNLANQSSNFNNLYWGGNPSGGAQTGGTFGYGSTVPHFSWTGSPYYSGNGTDTSTPIGGGGGYGSGGGNAEQEILGYLQSLGPASSQTLQSALPELQRRYPGLRPDTSGGPLDEIYIPGVGLRDVITNAETGGARNWVMQGGGGGGSFGGGGSIPGMALQDYGNLMGMGQGLFGQYGNLYSDIRGDYAPYLGAASNMATTGGLSDEDKGNIRARAISPIRSVYANALRNVNQQKALQGGYSPGYTTAMGRFNREMGQGVSDATTNAEGMIAELVQRGKLGGLGAWGSGLGGQTSGLLGALGGAGNTLGTMGQIYGTQPGMAQLFGNQALAAQAQQLDAARLQNQLSLGLLEAQNESARIPGNYQQALGNIGGTLDTIGRVGGAIKPWLNRTPRIPSTTPTAGLPPQQAPTGPVGTPPSAYGVGAETASAYGGVLPPVTQGTNIGYAGGMPAYTDYAAQMAESGMPAPMGTGSNFTFGQPTQSVGDIFNQGLGTSTPSPYYNVDSGSYNPYGVFYYPGI